jgi:hypothetical protein
MPWVKRNLYFVIGATFAVLLLGLAGFYFYSKWKLNNLSGENLAAAYADWDRITKLNPSPGNERVDNIRLAREHQEKVREALVRVRKQFVPIPAIPNSPNVGREEFADALRTTVERLSREAAGSGVTLPPQYNFTFNVQRTRVSFAQGSLQPLSVQLGEIRTICDVLFRAKINSLDGLRREPVSLDDQAGSATDYLEPQIVSVTNDLAVITPYSVTFRCFSTELGAVLSGFANLPHGIIVKSLNVEPGPVSAAPTPGMIAAGVPQPTMPTPSQPGGSQPRLIFENGEWYDPVTGEIFLRPPPRTQQPQPQPQIATPRSGSSVVLDERELRITMELAVVKLLPPKQ